jgi:hypothetical protein
VQTSFLNVISSYGITIRSISTDIDFEFGSADVNVPVPEPDEPLVTTVVEFNVIFGNSV